MSNISKSIKARRSGFINTFTDTFGRSVRSTENQKRRTPTKAQKRLQSRIDAFEKSSSKQGQRRPGSQKK